MPIRFISEKIGSQIVFSAGQIKIKRGTGTIVLSLGSREASVNGGQKHLSRPPLVEHGVTFVPLRFIAEAFKARVQFEGGNISISIPKN